MRPTTMMMNPDDIVISGISGRFPDADDVSEFRYNLENKIDMTSEDNRRWKIDHPEIPKRSGKINHVTKFDTGFFGIHPRQANTMDATCRMLLERTVEAILDAGVHPSELEGTRTAVIVGICFSETERKAIYHNPRDDSFTMTGVLRSMNAHRISYWLKLQGPSYIADTACSSSLYALEQAYRAIKSGQCDAAIVAGANLCFEPYFALQFKRLGVLSSDGRCKCFDEAADGYARSEAIVSVFLQKAKHSKRIYSTLVHSKTNCDGFKPEAITFPSSTMQKVLLKEVYEECQIDPSTLTFLEAHGTGTTVGDPEEVSAIDEVFCKNRKTPLLLTSVKSSIGHSEAASGLCSIARVLVSMETDRILPNVNFKKPRESITALKEGRCVVVTETTPWKNDDGLVGVNSFGFGGANCHVLLQRNPRAKQNGGFPQDNLPRLVCLSGRTEESVKAFVDDVNKRRLDVEYIRLLHEIFSKNIPGHVYRGYVLVSKYGELTSHIKRNPETERPFYIFFTGPESYHKPFDTALLGLPLFKPTFERIHKILEPTRVNLFQILQQDQQGQERTFENFLVNGAVQIALIEVFRLLDVSPTAYIGASTGAIICAYAEGCLSLEKAVLLLFYFALDLESTNGLIKGKVPLSPNLLGNIENLLDDPKRFLDCLKRSSSLELLQKYLPQRSVVLHIGSADPRATSKDVTLIRFPEQELTISLLVVLGKLYEEGYCFKTHHLYPQIPLPVSRGTPMISPLVKWNHSDEWFTAFYYVWQETKDNCRWINLSTKNNEWSFVTGHVINGRNLFPATGYVNFIWETLSKMCGKMLSDMKVVFEEVKFHRATTLSEKKNEFLVMIQRCSGRFEVIEGGVALVTGWVRLTEETVSTFTSQETTNYLPLDENDIYKELRLRGYNYSGLFRGLRKCSNNASSALLQWKGNWIAFMDNMLQMIIMKVDSRNLYVPTGIKRLIIDAKAHIAYAQRFGEEPLLPVCLSKEAGLIRSGGIFILGVTASAISKRKTLAEPVLEKYTFVPNETTLTLRDSTRTMAQIILENNYNVRFKGLELLEQAADKEEISPLILEALADLPLIQPVIAILKENEKIGSESDHDVIIGTNLLKKPQVLQEALSALKPKGFLLSRETLPDLDQNLENIEVVANHKIIDMGNLVLLRKIRERRPSERVVHITDDYDQFEWLKQLQTALRYSDSVLLYSQNENSGLMGLTNCLRMEERGGDIRCVFIMDSAPEFHPDHPFYQKQLSKGLAINVFKDCHWGTFRHLPIQKDVLVETEHCFARTTVKGDISSLKWFEGRLDSKKLNTANISERLVQVHYAALNFRDIMVASGRISADAVSKDRTEQYCLQGLEFAGIDSRGKRVMGIVPTGALSSLVLADPLLLTPIPNEWSLEDAVTVPVVYATVIYAFFMRSQLKRGQSVLIHAGSGGVGQAAINIALSLDCEVYTTVGTKEKREFLKNNFPQLKDSNIGNSRDTSFEKMVKRGTRGRGVDVVLNSLAEEKLQASVRCLAKGGTFLEIGKFDLESDHDLSLEDFSFHGIMVDTCMTRPAYKKELMELIAKFIRLGAVKPLVRTIFEKEDLEKGFRYMASGKHVGKVVIKMRDEGESSLFKGLPMYHCAPEDSFIITGGLGGFGLELADWLVLRGARKLILSSRSGIKNGYQSSRIRTWRSYGATIEIATDDIKTEEGCRSIISKAIALGPVKAIFNLAVVLRDAVISNQNAESFRSCFEPKAIAVHHFDKITRESCPQLRDFVVFSSVSCGRGNGGQTNYGMANSIMERICERRRKDGLPGLAIQWGAIGDVGLVAQMQKDHRELNIGGTLQQRIDNCLEVLDVLLKQPEAVVSSMVVAEKNTSGAVDNIVEYVAGIIGIRDVKTISFQSTLPELGMDSMMAVEMKQTLEREFGVFLSPQDIRSLTFARLQEIQNEIDATKSKGKQTTKTAKGIHLRLLLKTVEQQLPEERLIRLPSLVEEDAVAPKIFTIPGAEGSCHSLTPVAKELPAHVFCFQYISEGARDTVEEMARGFFECMQGLLTPEEDFLVVAHSFGCVIALELLAILKNSNRRGNAIFIDGSPEYLIKATQVPLDINSIDFEMKIIVGLMGLVLQEDEIMKHVEALLKCKNFEERVEVAAQHTKNSNLSESYQRAFALAFYRKTKALVSYRPQLDKVDVSVTLFRPEEKALEDIEEDYNLSKIVGSSVSVKYFKGDHFTILGDPELPAAICEEFKLKNEAIS